MFSLVLLFIGILLCGVASAEDVSILGLEPGSTRLANDDVGVILWGPNHSPTLNVGKSDVWDRRLPKEKPVITMKDIVRMAEAGDPVILDGAAWYTAYNHYDFPCPKPVGQVIFRLPFLDDGGTLSLDVEPRRITLVARHGEKRLTLRVFVSSVRNLIVVHGHGTGLEKGDVAIRLYRHRDTIVPGGELHPTIAGKHSPQDFEQLPMPRAGLSGDGIWIAQDFPPERTFPEGFTAMMAAKVEGAVASRVFEEGKTNLGTPMTAEKEGRITHMLTKRYTPINEAPGSAATLILDALEGAFTAYVAVVTTQDAADPSAHSALLLDEAARAGLDTLWKEHTSQLDAYEARPRARVWSDDGNVLVDSVWGGVPYRLRPDGYYGDVPLCSVDSTKFCYQDSSAWHADFHFNEIDATAPCMLRQFDMLDSYFRMIRALLPMAQANAREVYGCSGAMYPLVHYPLRADTVIHSHVTWEQSIEITALLVRPFWLRFLYTYDTEFLRESAYPVMREGARFYADFLKLEADGLYHVFPTVSPEHRGITKGLAFNRDSQSGITLIRYHLNATAQAASLLGEDAEEARKWKDIAGRMPDYPVADTPDGTVYVDVAGAQPIEYNIPVPLSAVFWGDDIGLESPPETLALARRTLEHINVWEPHRGYLKRVRARLGVVAPEDGISLENVLQSYTHVIRVFPAVPENFSGGFENLGAQGAFVVSAARTSHGVRSVRLSSLAGNHCLLANPWPDGDARVVDVTSARTVVHAESRSLIAFATVAWHDYLVTHASDEGRMP